MAAPLSLDLRRRIAAAGKHASAAQTAERFQVSIRTVQRLRALERKTGSVAPPPYRRGPLPKLRLEDKAFFERLLEEDPSTTQTEMARRFEDATGTTLSQPVVSQALRRWGITRKKR